MDSFNNDFEFLMATSPEKVEKNLAEVLNYINIDLDNLSRLLSSYHPLEILKMAFWEERRVSRTQKDESQRLAARLLPVALQSIVISTGFEMRSRNRNVLKKDWQRILSLNQDLARRMDRYIDFKTVELVQQGRLDKENASVYHHYLFDQFFPSDVEETTIRSQARYARLFVEADAYLFKSKYGVSADTLVDEVEKVALSSLNAIDKLREDSTLHKTLLMLEMARLRGEKGNEEITEEELRQKALLNPELYQENLRLQGLRDDFDMFRPEFYSNIPTSLLEEFSAEVSSKDLGQCLFTHGYWPCTVFPFIKLSNFYFTFIGKKLLGITQRVLKDRLGLEERLTKGTEEAVSSLFTQTDVLGVYSFDGNKIDVKVLSTVAEINSYESPELFNSILSRRKDELSERPLPGHRMLYVSPEGTETLEELSEGVFKTSLNHLLSIKDDKSERRIFYSSIFGEFQEVGAEELGDVYDEDETVEDNPVDEDILLDELSLSSLDEYETEDDEESDDSSQPDEEELLDVSRYDESEEESVQMRKTYDETHEHVLKSLVEDEVSNDFPEEVLEDDDTFLEDEEEEREEEAEEEEEIEPQLEDIEESLSEEEELSEIEDEIEDPDQLTFMELLDEYDDEVETDDTDEDQKYSTPIEDSALDEGFSELETDDTDEDEYYKHENTIAPVFNDIIQSEIEYERNEEEPSLEAPVVPIEIEEPIRDNDIVESHEVEHYSQCVESPSEIDEESVRRLFDLDREESEESYSPDPERKEYSEAEFFGIDSDDIDNSEEEVRDVEDSLDSASADFFDVDSDESEDSLREDSTDAPLIEAEDVSRQEVASEAQEVVSDEEPASSKDSAGEEEKAEEPSFSLYDPDEEQEKNKEGNPSVLLPEEEFVNIIDENDDAGDFYPESLLKDEDYSENDEKEIQIEETPVEENVRILEVQEAEKADEPVEQEEEDTDSSFNPVEEKQGDIVLEYDEDSDEEEDEKEPPASQELLIDEIEASEEEKVFTLSEEDIGKGNAIPMPEIQEEIVEQEDDEVVESTHTVDLENPKYSETIRQIAQQLLPDVGVFADFIENEDRSVLDYFNSVIRQCWERQYHDGKDKMFSIFEYDLSVLLVKNRVFDSLRETELMNNAGAVMYSKGKKEWNALIVNFSKEFKVEFATMKKITKEDFSPSDWKIVTVIGEELIARGQK